MSGEGGECYSHAASFTSVNLALTVMPFENERPGFRVTTCKNCTICN